ncbi:FLYWCH zinc finger domain-containing protein [Phthorimaea operculella]|nr:FLYWCH zinc finger domain-containing protein [Phthorimaea operculella]
MTIKTWYCTRASSNCKARFTTTIDGSLVQVSSNQHNHAPPRFVILTYVLNKAGKKIAVYAGNSFYLHKVFGSTKRWPCTRYGLKCRACLTTTLDGVLLRANDVHNHKPPRFVIHNGIYTKI